MNNPIDFADYKKEEDINYFLKKLKYAYFISAEKVDSVTFSVEEYYYLIKGLVYDESFFLIDFDNKVVKIYPIRTDGLLKNDKSGVYVSNLFDIDVIGDDNIDLQKEFINNNLSILKEVDHFYDKICNNGYIPYSNDNNFLIELDKKHNGKDKVIEFKK